MAPVAEAAETLVCLGGVASSPPAARELLGAHYRLRDAAPEQGSFSLWARGGACTEALRQAAALRERLSALVLESPGEVPEAAPLAQLTVPTLVVCGSDASADTARVLRERLPNCHFVLVYAAGDDVATHRPQAFASLVEDFLERRERFIVNNRSGLLHP
jgi:pimeloyl-ACP methyl ester carboxylesterase